MSDHRTVKLTMLMLLALLVISHGVGNISCSTVPENSTDMLALLDFKAVITNDPSGSLSSWNTSIHYCKWRGVTCNTKNHGRVTALRLYNQGLSGSISPSVGNLTFLHTLDLSTNQFSGQIPHLNNLQKMQILNLSYNSLDGVIPDTLTNCSNLKELHLYHNLLNGAIPREIGLLKNLVFFALNNNNLTGTIPPSLGNITHIKEFYLQVNHLKGTIPDELGHFSNISMLDLGENMLSGGSSSNEPDGGGSSGDEEVGSPVEGDDGGGLDWEDEGSTGGRRDATVGKKVMIRANRFLVNVAVCVCVSLGYGCVLMK